MSTLYYESSICHHGIRGQRWGVRRYQNADGSLTAKGQKRYQKEQEKVISKERNAQRKLAMENLKINEARKTAAAKAALEENKRMLEEEKNQARGRPSGRDMRTSERRRGVDVSTMSDEELYSIINRINLETRYREAVYPKTPEKNHAARDLVNDMFTTGMKNVNNAVTKGLGKKLSNALFGNDGSDKKKKKKDDDDDDD